MSKRTERRESATLPFVRGGLAGVIGWLPIHPADLIKVRLQTSGPTSPNPLYTGTVHALKSVVSENGVRGLYSGLSAGLTRQIFYTTIRLGLYDTIRSRISNEDINWNQKLGIGLISGGVASLISTPIEVCLVRMQANSNHYRNVGDALVRIGREEGVAGLTRGATPTVVRAMIVSAVQLGVYDIAKQSYIECFSFDDAVPVHIAASLTSGYAYSVVTKPIDLAKSRMMNEIVAKDGKRQYRNIVQTICRIGATEGVLSLFKGFGPYFARCGGHTVAMYVIVSRYYVRIVFVFLLTSFFALNAGFWLSSRSKSYSNNRLVGAIYIMLNSSTARNAILEQIVT